MKRKVLDKTLDKIKIMKSFTSLNPQIKRLSAFSNAKSPIIIGCEFQKVLKPLLSVVGTTGFEPSQEGVTTRDKKGEIIIYDYEIISFSSKYFPVLMSSDISQHHRLSFKMGTILGTIQ